MSSSPISFLLRTFVRLTTRSLFRKRSLNNSLITKKFSENWSRSTKSRVIFTVWPPVVLYWFSFFRPSLFRFPDYDISSTISLSFLASISLNFIVLPFISFTFCFSSSLAMSFHKFPSIPFLSYVLTSGPISSVLFLHSSATFLYIFRYFSILKSVEFSGMSSEDSSEKEQVLASVLKSLSL